MQSTGGFELFALLRLFVSALVNLLCGIFLHVTLFHH